MLNLLFFLCSPFVRFFTAFRLNEFISLASRLFHAGFSLCSRLVRFLFYGVEILNRSCFALGSTKISILFYRLRKLRIYSFFSYFNKNKSFFIASENSEIASNLDITLTFLTLLGSRKIRIFVSTLLKPCYSRIYKNLLFENFSAFIRRSIIKSVKFITRSPTNV